MFLACLVLNLEWTWISNLTCCVLVPFLDRTPLRQSDLLVHSLISYPNGRGILIRLLDDVGFDDYRRGANHPTFRASQQAARTRTSNQRDRAPRFKLCTYDGGFSPFISHIQSFARRASERWCSEHHCAVFESNMLMNSCSSPRMMNWRNLFINMLKLAKITEFIKFIKIHHDSSLFLAIHFCDLDQSSTRKFAIKINSKNAWWIGTMIPSDIDIVARVRIV